MEVPEPGASGVHLKGPVIQPPRLRPCLSSTHDAPSEHAPLSAACRYVSVERYVGPAAALALVVQLQVRRKEAGGSRVGWKVVGDGSPIAGQTVWD